MAEQLYGDQTLGTLLRESSTGDLAVFAALYNRDDAAAMLSDNVTGDAAGRKIYQVFKEWHPTEADELDGPELCTDLYFDLDQDLSELPTGHVIEKEIENDMFGKIGMFLVKLSENDADFLLGVLPDALLNQMANFTEAE